MTLHTGVRVDFTDFSLEGLALGIKRAQKPYIVWSLGPEALIYESLDPEGWAQPPNSESKPEFSKKRKLALQEAHIWVWRNWSVCPYSLNILAMYDNVPPSPEPPSIS